MTRKYIDKSVTKIAILCGGVSSEHDISILSGRNIYKVIDRNKYEPTLIEITKSGQWLVQGKNDRTNKISVIDTTSAKMKSDLSKFDVVFVALHGRFGEDGKIQSLLELVGVPYTGSGVMASALSMNKKWALDLVSSIGVKTPRTIITEKADSNRYKAILEKVGLPCVVKPNNSGSSVAISIVRKANELIPAINLALREDKSVLIQEYIGGREFTCSVIGNSSQGKIKALPMVEIVTDNEFFDFDAKYTSKATKEIVPAGVSDDITDKIQRVAIDVHKLISCDGLTRSDFIMDARGSINFLEINTVPGMTAMSLSPKSARASGMSMAELVDEIISLALQKHRPALQEAGRECI